MSTESGILTRDLYILEDESNPQSSKSNKVYPSTIIDQIYDNKSPTQRTLRDILNDIQNEIITGGKENIIYPVTSVNGLQGDVVITVRMLGLENVDNTHDIEKPLSNPQRAEIEKRLSTFKPEVDLSELYNHINDKNNPHNVTIEQLNQGGYIDGIVNSELASHNVNRNTHEDIRGAIRDISAELSSFKYTETNNHQVILNTLNNHIGDSAAHASIFNTKENISNKSINMNDVNNNNYPTTKAVVEYVSKQIQLLKDSLNDPDQWIDDIIVIEDRTKLPEADECFIHKAYFIRKGVGAEAEVALCRQLANDAYAWDISQYGPISRYNTNQFIDSTNGLSININNISDAVINSTQGSTAVSSIVNNIMNKELNKYYSKKDIDNMNLVSNIKIITGTMNGCIRYYINDDQTTMSDDIRVSGLQKLAFMESITGDEIDKGTIWGEHIAAGSITHDHLTKKCVNATNMSAGYNTILGNISDELDGTVKEISIKSLSDALRPFLSDLDIDLDTMTDTQIETAVDNAYTKVNT